MALQPASGQGDSSDASTSSIQLKAQTASNSSSNKPGVSKGAAPGSKTAGPTSASLTGLKPTGATGSKPAGTTGPRPEGAAKTPLKRQAAGAGQAGTKPRTKQPSSPVKAKKLLPKPQAPKWYLPVAVGSGVLGGALLLWQLIRLLKRHGASADTVNGDPANPGPCARVKPSAKCVALADGSACVIRRSIPADNSCLFNAVAYCMHGSKQKAEFLRSVVAREVSSDPETWSGAFLGMHNTAYCNWIIQPHNWGGGIELAILAKHYGREISAWQIEAVKQHVFGEDAGHPRRVMLIYTGTHYEALAIAKSPRAPESEDKTEFNPRTKNGKMVLEAAQKLVQLSQKGGKRGARSQPAKKPAAPAKPAIKAATVKPAAKAVVTAKAAAKAEATAKPAAIAVTAKLAGTAAPPPPSPQPAAAAAAAAAVTFT